MPTVILDPGHGGSDPGAVGNGTTEKERNLAMAYAVKSAFERQGAGVIMTRSSDIAVILSQQTTIENAKDADLFISLHIDSAPQNPAASGFTFWLHSDAPQSYIDWAASMYEGIKAVGLTTNRAQVINRGYTGDPNADYFVNNNTNAPSVLIECGFITHKGNVDDNRAKIEKYAEAIVKGSCKFLGIDYRSPDESVPPIPSTGDQAQLIEQLEAENRSLKSEISDLKAKINKAKDALA